MIKKNSHREYGKTIADAVLAEVDSPTNGSMAKSRSWMDSWIDPAQARDRSRRWLSMWLKGDLKDVPPHVASRYLSEMAKDIERLGSNEAVERFVDKLLPEIISNASSSQERTKHGR